MYCLMPFVKLGTAIVVIGVLLLGILMALRVSTMTATALIKTVSVLLTPQKELRVGLVSFPIARKEKEDRTESVFLLALVEVGVAVLVVMLTVQLLTKKMPVSVDTR